MDRENQYLSLEKYSNKMKYIWIILSLLITGTAQARQSLTVGDGLPDFIIPKIINSVKPTANTADLKEQLLIIDFWATNCSGCVEALPKMEALQKEFCHKIKILPVTKEPADLVRDFWKKNKNTRLLTLSSVVEDKLFSDYFKHLGMPHEVWVYKGKVVAITDGDYVNVRNIRMILEGKQVNWPVKYDFYNFDGSKQALFGLDSNQIAADVTTVQYAAISDYKEGVNSVGLTGGSGVVRNVKNKTVRVFFLNQAIYTSYLLNWNKLVKPGSLVKPATYSIGPNEVIWEVKDKSRYSYEKGVAYQAEWIRKNGICFESLNPDTGQNNTVIYRSVIKDLNRLLGLNARWEKRKEKVLVLTRIGKHAALKETSPSSQEFPVSAIVYSLNQQPNNPYVFDESGFKGSVMLNLRSISWTDIPAIRKTLLGYGLDLKEKEWLVDKFVFSEVKGSLLSPLK